jgi:hypothetical protein
MFHKLIPTIFLLSTSIFTVRAATLFSGSGTSGTSSGEGWSLDNDMGQLSIYDDWGMPGVFSNGVDNTGEDVWNNPSADVITFTFALPDGITADSTGMVAAGRFWNGSISSDGLTVTFTPLAGIPINPGDYFELDVEFTSLYSPGDVLESSFSFTGSASNTPEPANIATLGFGLAGLALARGRSVFRSVGGSAANCRFTKLLLGSAAFQCSHRARR